MSLSSMIKPLTISLSLGALFLASCKPGAESAKPPIHPNPNMDKQEKYMALSESPFFEDGRTMRPEVAETVPYGELVQDPALRDGERCSRARDEQRLKSLPSTILGIDVINGHVQHQVDSLRGHGSCNRHSDRL